MDYKNFHKRLNKILFESIDIFEDIVSMQDYKDKKIQQNIEDLCNSLLEVASEINPENPYELVAERFEEMSKWGKKDWEQLFKRKLEFSELRDGQLAMERLAKRIREIAEKFELSKNENLEESIEERTQVLNQKELINHLCKYKYEYRIIYDENKDWYIIGTAYDKIHETLFYNSSADYGLTFTEMIKYYDEHVEQLHDLLYSPKEGGLKVGFDHNDKLYTFEKFGSIYTKGPDLPQVLLDDLTERFGEPIITEAE